MIELGSVNLSVDDMAAAGSAVETTDPAGNRLTLYHLSPEASAE